MGNNAHVGTPGFQERCSFESFWQTSCVRPHLTGTVMKGAYGTWPSIFNYLQAALGSLQCSRKEGLMDSLWSSWRTNIKSSPERERDLAGVTGTKQFWQWFARCPEERWGVVSAASETLCFAMAGTGRTTACSNLRLCMDLNQLEETRKRKQKDLMTPCGHIWED